MHVCALICDCPSIAFGERVQREAMATVYVQVFSTLRVMRGFFFLLPSGFFAQLPAVWAAVWASVCVYQSSLHLFPWKTILHGCAYSTTQWRCRVWLTLAALPHTLTHQGCCLGPFGFLAAETLGHASVSLMKSLNVASLPSKSRVRFRGLRWEVTTRETSWPVVSEKFLNNRYTWQLM